MTPQNRRPYRDPCPFVGACDDELRDIRTKHTYAILCDKVRWRKSYTVVPYLTMVLAHKRDEASPRGPHVKDSASGLDLGYG